MSARPIPDGVLRTWPEVDPDSWEWLSQHRLRGNHPSKPGAVTLVVSVFGEKIGQGLPAGYTPQQERDTYALLFEAAAELAAHREACANGTPIVRPDTEANFGVVGRCWWCGKWPSEHNPPSGEAEPDCADDCHAHRTCREQRDREAAIERLEAHVARARENPAPIATEEAPADSRPRGAAVRAAAGNGEADPVPQAPGAGSADSDNLVPCLACEGSPLFAPSEIVAHLHDVHGGEGPRPWQQSGGAR